MMQSSSVISLSDSEDEQQDVSNDMANSTSTLNRVSDPATQNVNESQMVPEVTKMELLEEFMEQPEPLVVETKSQYAFLVSVIRNLADGVQKCNLQNLPK